MRNPNNVVKKVAKMKNILYRGVDTNKPPSFEGWSIAYEDMLCIEGVILLRVGRGRVRVHQ